MSHPLGLKLWSTNTDAYLEEAVRLYQEGVFQYLELYAVPGSLGTAANWKATEIPCIVHAPHSAHKVNLADYTKRAYNRAIFEETQRFADALHAPVIIAHGGANGPAEEVGQQLALMNDTRLLIENKPLLPIDGSDLRLVGSTPEEIACIQSLCKCGFCLDIGHMISSANAHHERWESYFNAFLQLTPQIFHLSDLDITSELDQHLHFGEGTLPLKQILSMLPKGTPISIETTKNSKENLNDFAQDVEDLKAMA